MTASKIRTPGKTIKEETYSTQVLQIYVQALLSYHLNRHWYVGAGYGFQRTNPFLDNWRNEHRLVQQVNYIFHINRSIIFNRLRFEERFFSYPHSAGQLGTRARWQAGFATPFSKNSYWQINDEAYVIPSGPRNSYFSENRVYSGVGFRTKYIGQFETGIGYNSIVRNSKKDFTNYLLLQVAWSYKIHAREKNAMNAIIHNRQF